METPVLSRLRKSLASASLPEPVLERVITRGDDVLVEATLGPIALQFLRDRHVEEVWFRAPSWAREKHYALEDVVTAFGWTTQSVTTFEEVVTYLATHWEEMVTLLEPTNAQAWRAVEAAGTARTEKFIEDLWGKKT